MKTIIKNAYVLTMNELGKIYEDGCVLIQDDKIIYVGNEIECPNYDDAKVIDAKNNVIWRCLQQNKYKMYLQKIKSFLLKPNDNRNQKKLVINRQCRPYHLGWLLYAFSDKI